MYYVFPVCILCILVIQQNSLVYTGQNVSLYILQTAKLMTYRTTKSGSKSKLPAVAHSNLCIHKQNLCIHKQKQKSVSAHLCGNAFSLSRICFSVCYDTYILPPMNSLNIESFMIADVSSISLKKLNMPSILCASAYSG